MMERKRKRLSTDGTDWTDAGGRARGGIYSRGAAENAEGER